jgi:hypothetical protein
MIARSLSTASVILCAWLLLGVDNGWADKPGTRTVAAPHSFDVLLGRLECAIEDNGMGVVAQAGRAGAPPPAVFRYRGTR